MTPFKESEKKKKFPAGGSAHGREKLLQYIVEIPAVCQKSAGNLFLLFLRFLRGSFTGNSRQKKNTKFKSHNKLDHVFFLDTVLFCGSKNSSVRRNWCVVLVEYA